MFGGAKKWSERKIKPKLCKECNVEFLPNCGGNLYCDSCKIIVKRRTHAKTQRNWRAKNPEAHAKLKANWDLKKYGIDSNEYDRLLKEQNNCCAICKEKNVGGRGIHRKFAVDHCHTTKKVRGLLCHLCNTALGLLKDNIGILDNAKRYLERSS